MTNDQWLGNGNQLKETLLGCEPDRKPTFEAANVLKSFLP